MPGITSVHVDYLARITDSGGIIYRASGSATSNTDFSPPEPSQRLFLVFSGSSPTLCRSVSSPPLLRFSSRQQAGKGLPPALRGCSRHGGDAAWKTILKEEKGAQAAAGRAARRNWGSPKAAASSVTPLQPSLPLCPELPALPAERRIFLSALLPGRSTEMQPVPLHSLSELERASLQEIALYQLQEKRLVGDLRLAKVGPKGSKSIRQKLESFSKEKKDCSPQTFGIPLFQVIANDRAYKQLQEEVKKSRRLCLEVEATVKRFQAQRQKRSPMGRSCVLVPCGLFPEEPLSPTLLHNGSWSQRRGAMSVDSITDLSDNTSKLLEALQLSHPHELDPRRSLGKTKMLSLNPITWQVPRIVERCCKHIETHGLQTVGIFRVGSSKKRVQQLREEFDQGLDVFLDEHQSVHDVAALLKEFLRDMPDPLIPRELYAAFLSTAAMEGPAQLAALQLLLFLLPPCHSDTLHRLLRFLSEVARHAEGSRGPDGQQIPGNKMTVSNLATIFGPNILQKEKPGEKDTGAMNFEDSAAIILVLQRLIEHYQTLFMVSPETQRDVLRRLFQTDPDVIDYLLRRKLNAMPSTESEDSREEHAPLPAGTHTLGSSSVSSELYSNVSFLNLDVGI
ncbi:rho GTPase-activating protein 36 isoform X3 [Rissa tridactyla]|uniref:rho GTPase-activating protein 36 isoform X3 n=1 Tax=Rissa tridactyla TaxID=75485 RepID=UPI0023BA8FC5|nr:rho GTPase-activating protein 36 isoform X3 [Rissa tridactyla]